MDCYLCIVWFGVEWPLSVGCVFFPNGFVYWVRAEPVKCGRFPHNKNQGKTKPPPGDSIRDTWSPIIFLESEKRKNFEHFRAHRVTIRSSGHEEKLPGWVKNVFLFWIFHLNSPTKVTSNFFDQTRGYIEDDSNPKKQIITWFSKFIYSLKLNSSSLKVDFLPQKGKVHLKPK